MCKYESFVYNFVQVYRVSIQFCECISFEYNFVQVYNFWVQFAHNFVKVYNLWMQFRAIVQYLWATFLCSLWDLCVQLCTQIFRIAKSLCATLCNYTMSVCNILQLYNFVYHIIQPVYNCTFQFWKNLAAFREILRVWMLEVYHKHVEIPSFIPRKFFLIIWCNVAFRQACDKYYHNATGKLFQKDSRFQPLA